jgi:hypothetical protein
VGIFDEGAATFKRGHTDDHGAGFGTDVCIDQIPQARDSEVAYNIAVCFVRPVQLNV